MGLLSFPKQLVNTVGGGFTPDNPLLFVHIYKTGGSSLRHQLEMSCGLRQTQGVYTRVGGVKERIKGYLPEEELENCGASMYYGHMFHGVHRRLAVPATYATFLREPVRRAISHHQHMNRHAAERRGRPVSLLSAVESGDVQLDNLQTRFISGFRGVPFGQLTREHLRVAKQNLSDFVFVGVLERESESLAWLNELLDISIGLDKRINVASPAPDRPGYTADEMAAVDSINRFDHELYEFGCELLDSRGADSTRG